MKENAELYFSGGGVAVVFQSSPCPLKVAYTVCSKVNLNTRCKVPFL